MNNGADVTLMRLKVAVSELETRRQSGARGRLVLTGIGPRIEMSLGDYSVHRLVPWLEVETANFEVLKFIIETLEQRLLNLRNGP